MRLSPALSDNTHDSFSGSSMDHQLTFADSEFSPKRRQTRK
jgi:hypothetical protein